MRRVLKTGRALAALALVCGWAATAAGAQAPAPEAGPFAAKVEGFLRQSGYDFRRVKANSWYIVMRGEEMPEIRVLIGAGPNSIAVAAVVVPKARLRVTADSMFKMMKLSYDLNYVRLCVDPDDDLLVMEQARERHLDLAHFKEIVERVAAAADRAYGEMRPFLN